MTITPRTEDAIHDTANDFRALGQAVKQDMRDLRQNAAHKLDECTHQAKAEMQQNLAQVREFTVHNPFRALGYAALTGVVLGLWLRR